MEFLNDGTEICNKVNDAENRLGNAKIQQYLRLLNRIKMMLLMIQQII